MIYVIKKKKKYLHVNYNKSQKKRSSICVISCERCHLSEIYEAFYAHENHFVEKIDNAGQKNRNKNNGKQRKKNPDKNGMKMQ